MSNPKMIEGSEEFDSLTVEEAYQDAQLEALRLEHDKTVKLHNNIVQQGKTDQAIKAYQTYQQRLLNESNQKANEAIDQDTNNLKLKETQIKANMERLKKLLA